MKITKTEDIIKLKKQIIPELSNNPSFYSVFDATILDMIKETGSVDVVITQDGKKIVINAAPILDISRSDLKTSKLQFAEITISMEGMLRKETGYASCVDAEDYYRLKNTNKNDTSCLLNVSYGCFFYDETGIEMSRHYAGESDCKLIGVNYDEYDMLMNQLVSRHRPNNWTHMCGADINNNDMIHSYTSDFVRSYDNPCIIEMRNCEFNNGLSIDNYTMKMAHVHYEYPEIIRIDETDIFAEFNGNEYVPTVDIVKIRGDISYEKLFEEECDYSIIGLDRSETRKRNPEIYEVLKARAVEANEKLERSARKK